MTKELSVRLEGLEIGTLSLINGKMEFVYKNTNIKPISLSLPLQTAPFKEKICRAFFGGLLPENPNIREILSKKYKIGITNDFKLLEIIGRDCAGALSFHSKDEPEIKQEFSEITGEFLSDIEFEKYLKELPYKPYMGNRLSLAGAQEKTAICLIDNKFALPNKDVPTTHIIKTALPNYPQTIQNEYFCMKVANLIGIKVPNVEIRKVGNVEFLLVERFDRIVKNKKIKRILQEDFAQSLGIQSRNKYEVTIKDCLNVLNQTTYPAKNKIEFTKRVIFNYLIGNTDAHAKNFSLFLNNNIELTPAYDILCSSIYDCDQRIAMKIGKAKFYKDITNEDWKLFAKDLDVSYRFVINEINRQEGLIVKAFEEVNKSFKNDIFNKIMTYYIKIKKS